MIDLIQKITGRFFKRYYWYRIEYKYIKDGTTLISFQQEVGIRYKRLLGNMRAIKKNQLPESIKKNKSIKQCLCNGEFNAYPQSYLGWW